MKLHGRTLSNKRYLAKMDLQINKKKHYITQKRYRLYHEIMFNTNNKVFTKKILFRLCETTFRIFQIIIRDHIS